MPLTSVESGVVGEWTTARDRDLPPVPDRIVFSSLRVRLRESERERDREGGGERGGEIERGGEREGGRESDREREGVERGEREREGVRGERASDREREGRERWRYIPIARESTRERTHFCWYNVLHDVHSFVKLNM